MVQRPPRQAVNPAPILPRTTDALQLYARTRKSISDSREAAEEHGQPHGPNDTEPDSFCFTAIRK
jgi:hypothetical protein